MSSEYQHIPADDVPTGIVWITPRRFQGQIVEVSYSLGIPAGKRINYDADDGDPWCRTIDHSVGSVSYSRLVSEHSHDS